MLVGVPPGLAPTLWQAGQMKASYRSASRSQKPVRELISMSGQMPTAPGSPFPQPLHR